MAAAAPKDPVFIIEDEIHYTELYTEVLKDDFNCVCFDNARNALTALESMSPKVIVLDLHLPDLNGIDFCKALKAQTTNNTEPDIIFVSGETDSNIKLAAFEVGASDFMTKPFELKELLFKVKSSIKRKAQEESYKQDITDSQKLIHTTMEQASQYSIVMRFFKNLSHCQSIEEVVNLFFTTMDSFQLPCSIRIALPTVAYFQSNKTDVPPIEKEVFEILHDKGRIFPFSNRMIINDKHVSFIIKALPDDEHAIGQIRDYVAAIIEGLEAKVLELYSQLGMNEAIKKLTNNIAELKQGVNEHNEITNSVMSNMMLEIASSYHVLDMTDAQEVFLSGLVEKSTNDLSKAEEHLVTIMGGLEGIRASMLNVQKAVEGGHDSSQATSDDIELF